MHSVKYKVVENATCLRACAFKRTALPRYPQVRSWRKITDLEDGSGSSKIIAPVTSFFQQPSIVLLHLRWYPLMLVARPLDRPSRKGRRDELLSSSPQAVGKNYTEGKGRKKRNIFGGEKSERQRKHFFKKAYIRERTCGERETLERHTRQTMAARAQTLWCFPSHPLSFLSFLFGPPTLSISLLLPLSVSLSLDHFGSLSLSLYFSVSLVRTG